MSNRVKQGEVGLSLMRDLQTSKVDGVGQLTGLLDNWNADSPIVYVHDAERGKYFVLFQMASGTTQLETQGASIEVVNDETLLRIQALVSKDGTYVWRLGSNRYRDASGEVQGGICNLSNVELGTYIVRAEQRKMGLGSLMRKRK